METETDSIVWVAFSAQTGFLFRSITFDPRKSGFDTKKCSDFAVSRSLFEKTYATKQKT